MGKTATAPRLSAAHFFDNEAHEDDGEQEEEDEEEQSSKKPLKKKKNKKKIDGELADEKVEEDGEGGEEQPTTSDDEFLAGEDEIVYDTDAETANDEEGLHASLNNKAERKKYRKNGTVIKSPGKKKAFVEPLAHVLTGGSSKKVAAPAAAAAAATAVAATKRKRIQVDEDDDDDDDAEDGDAEDGGGGSEVEASEAGSDEDREEEEATREFAKKTAEKKSKKKQKLDANDSGSDVEEEEDEDGEDAGDKKKTKTKTKKSQKPAKNKKKSGAKAEESTSKKKKTAGTTIAKGMPVNLKPVTSPSDIQSTVRSGQYYVRVNGNDYNVAYCPGVHPLKPEKGVNVWETVSIKHMSELIKHSPTANTAKAPARCSVVFFADGLAKDINISAARRIMRNCPPEESKQRYSVAQAQANLMETKGLSQKVVEVAVIPHKLYASILETKKVNTTTTTTTKNPVTVADDDDEDNKKKKKNKQHITPPSSSTKPQQVTPPPSQPHSKKKKSKEAGGVSVDADEDVVMTTEKPPKQQIGTRVTKEKNYTLTTVTTSNTTPSVDMFPTLYDIHDTLVTSFTDRFLQIEGYNTADEVKRFMMQHLQQSSDAFRSNNPHDYMTRREIQKLYFMHLISEHGSAQLKKLCPELHDVLHKPAAIVPVANGARMTTAAATAAVAMEVESKEIVSISITQEEEDMSLPPTTTPRLSLKMPPSPASTRKTLPPLVAAHDSPVENPFVF